VPEAGRQGGPSRLPFPRKSGFPAFAAFDTFAGNLHQGQWSDLSAGVPSREGARTVRRALVATTSILAFVLASGPAQAAPVAAAPVPGSPGLGDTYFPDYGNGGYDVSHYDVRLRYRPDTDQLTGTGAAATGAAC
jgi:hypothetical protein